MPRGVCSLTLLVALALVCCAPNGAMTPDAGGGDPDAGHPDGGAGNEVDGGPEGCPFVEGDWLMTLGTVAGDCEFFGGWTPVAQPMTCDVGNELTWGVSPWAPFDRQRCTLSGRDFSCVNDADDDANDGRFTTSGTFSDDGRSASGTANIDHASCGTASRPFTAALQ